MANKNAAPKNDNKKIICSFLGQDNNIKLPYKDSMAKFFAIEVNKIIRPDAFRFYYKGINEGKFEVIVPEKIGSEKVVKPEAK